MKFKAFLEKYLDYLPLFPVIGILLSLPGGAIRLHNYYYFIIGVVTIPVWILITMAALKIKKMGGTDQQTNIPSLGLPRQGGDGSLPEPGKTGPGGRRGG